jgi:hypothetical protein
MPINLTDSQIHTAINGLGRAIEKYKRIQTFLQDNQGSLLANSEAFTKLFNGYYRIGRKPSEWYQHYYRIFDESRNGKPSFSDVLEIMYQATGCYEASFCSKMVASINTNAPVIDSIVLGHLALKLSLAYQKNRHQRICDIYNEIISIYDQYLLSDLGKYLIHTFRSRHPNANLTKVKMVDFVIWNNR